MFFMSINPYSKFKIFTEGSIIAIHLTLREDTVDGPPSLYRSSNPS